MRTATPSHSALSSLITREIRLAGGVSAANLHSSAAHKAFIARDDEGQR